MNADELLEALTAKGVRLSPRIRFEAPGVAQVHFAEFNSQAREE